MIRESEIYELKNWLNNVHKEFNHGVLEPKRHEALGAMINILYGKKARPNKYRRGKK